MRFKSTETQSMLIALQDATFLRRWNSGQTVQCRYDCHALRAKLYYYLCKNSDGLGLEVNTRLFSSTYKAFYL